MFVWDFKNEKTKTHKVHYSRYIASWLNAGGKSFGAPFKEWLRDVLELTDEEVKDITDMAREGKLELELSAEKFLEWWNNSHEKEAMKFNVTRNE